MIKVNLGSWKRNFPGWINVDLHDYPHVHFKKNVDDLSMFDDDSIDLLYASHVLEYFSLKQAPQVLQEWNRVLKEGGVLKVCVPDFEALAKAYQKYGDVISMQGSLYATIDPPVILQGQYVHHKAMYDFKLLKRMLEEAGFTDIKRYDWKEFLPEGVTDHSASYIPSNDHKNGILVSLNLEARKASPAEALALKSKHAVEHLGNRIINKAKRIFKGQLGKKKEMYKI